MRLIYLFGSRAKVEARTSSDWDIVVMDERKLPAIDILNLKELIANEVCAVVDLVSKAALIPIELADTMKRMVGLRNIAVHDNQPLNLDIVIAVAKEHLGDFEEFCSQVIS